MTKNEQPFKKCENSFRKKSCSKWKKNSKLNLNLPLKSIHLNHYKPKPPISPSTAFKNATFSMPIKPPSQPSEDELSKILFEDAYQPSHRNYENLDLFITKKKGVFDTVTYSNTSSVSKSEFVGFK